MHRQTYRSQIPSPVPLLKPLSPPEYIIALCKQIKLGKKDNYVLQVIDQQNFKKLYEEKCQELILEITKSKSYEQLIVQLQNNNKELQNQVRRLQEQRWKSYDYSRLSARGRSKSQKRVIPVIEVKVPHNQKEPKIKQLNEQKYYPTERLSNTQKIIQYQQQLQNYKLQIKELKQSIIRNELKFAESEKSFQKNKLNLNNNEQKSIKRNQFDFSESPEKHTISQIRNRSIKTPQVNDFSPTIQDKDETVKKTRNYLQSVQLQIKRLKNELLYKDLLINKLREQKSKQNDILQKHLNLSIEETKKINEETSIILEKLKKQIIFLWKQLETEKQKNGRIEHKNYNQYNARKSQVLTKNQTINSLTVEKNDLLQLLRLRRNQKFQ